MGPVCFTPKNIFEALRWWLTIGSDRYPLWQAIRSKPFFLYASEVYKLSLRHGIYTIDFDSRFPRTIRTTTFPPELKTTLPLDRSVSEPFKRFASSIFSFSLGSASLWLIALQWVVVVLAGVLKTDLGDAFRTGTLELSKTCDLKCAQEIIKVNVLALTTLGLTLSVPLAGLICLINSFRKRGASVLIRRSQTVDALLILLTVGVPSIQEFFDQKNIPQFAQYVEINERHGFKWQQVWDGVYRSQKAISEQIDRAVAGQTK